MSKLRMSVFEHLSPEQCLSTYLLDNIMVFWCLSVFCTTKQYRDIKITVFFFYKKAILYLFISAGFPLFWLTRSCKNYNMHVLWLVKLI